MAQPNMTQPNPTHDPQARRSGGAKRMRRRPVNRRGNFFVLVVGTLALLSVIAIAYVSVGRSDRQLSSAIDRSGDLVEARDAVQDHILDVIGRDVTAALNPIGENAPDMKDETRSYRLETWDMPYTRSDLGSVAARPKNGVSYTFRFHPWGDGDDPWLAATMPEDLGVHTNGVPALAEELDDWMLDWGQISNVAPDGRFVNLWNLRQDFNAPPGSFGMSQNLTLLQPASINNADAEQAYVDTPTVLNGRAQLPFALNEFADPDRPSEWTSHQMGAFRPIAEARLNIGVNDFRYTPYQWADADGDGMADSRWFELVDSSNVDPNDINTLGEAQYILAPTDGYRWFAATRIIDLSGLLNVNIATDLTNVAQPGGTLSGDFDVLNAPIGASPADVDRLRVLAMEDVRRTFVDNTGANPLTYAAIPQASVPGDTPTPANDYRDYDETVAPLVADRANIEFGRDAGKWTGAPAGATTTDDPTDADLNQGTITLPEGGGDAGRVDGPDRRAEWYEESTRIGQDPVVAGGAASSNFDQPRPFDVDDQIELLTYWGANNPDITSRLERVLGVPFDLLDGTVAPGARDGRPFSPLRADRSRDVERRVDVENASGALIPDGVADDAYQAQVVTDIRRLLTTLSGARRLAGGSFEVDGAHPDNARLKLDLRRNSEAVAASLPDLIALHDEQKNRPLMMGELPAAEQIFSRIYRTLVPLADQQEVWQGDPDFDEFRYANYGYRSAELGMRLAAHLTANLLDSYDDDTDQSVFTLAVSEVGLNELDTSVNAGDLLSSLLPDFAWTRWNDEKLRLNSAGPHAPDMGAGTATPQSRHINVYGFEPQPFLTEVSSFYWYVDTPRGDATGNDPEGQFGATDWDFGPGEAAGGDIFGDPGPPVGWTFNNELPVNIDGSVDTANPDYIASIVVFQLHNPFGESIRLSSDTEAGGDGSAMGSADDFYYYIEFGGRTYKLVEYDWDSDEYQHIVLDAFETRNFYIIGENPRDGEAPDQRLDTAIGRTEALPMRPYYDDPDLTQGLIQRWIRQQASVRGTGLANILPGDDGEAVCLTEFDSSIEPATGTPIGVSQGTETADLLSATPEENQVVMLWKAVRSGDGPEVGFSNIEENDILVDRLRDPAYRAGGSGSGVQTLDARLFGGMEGDIGEGGPDYQFIQDNFPMADWSMGEIDGGTPDESVGANTNASVVTWASIKRVNDPLMPAAIPDNRQGVWGSYLLELKTGLYDVAVGIDTAPGTAQETLRIEQSDLLTGMVDYNQFSGNAIPEAHETILEMLEWQYGNAGGSSSPVHRTMIDEPRDKTVGGSMPANIAGQAYNDIRPDPFPRQQDPAAIRAVGDAGNSADDRGVVRVGELLSTLAIGGWYDPDFVGSGATGAARLAELESAWTTPAEALAIALDYQTRSVADTNIATGAVVDVFDDLSGPILGGGAARPALPRGSLSIDDFVPFIDRDGDGQFYAGEVDETNRDEPVGLGIPLAMELMDQFHGLPASANGPAELAPGLVNINTAPWAVLRTLPFLSPRFNDPSTIEIEFWDTGANSLGDNGLVQTDVASAIMAYRRMAPFPLAGLIGTVIDETPGLPMPSMAMDFSELQDGFNPSDPTIATPWAYASGIPGLREDNSVRDRSGVDTYAQDAPRGFRSLGELLAVRYRDPNNPLARSLHNITKLGENVGPDASTDDFQVVLEGQGYGTNAPPFGAGNQAMGIQPDGVENDLDERLAIFNAVSNIATVRSDLYAVWFVVHGYRESDVANLLPSDPLIPSASGRYLMIVDRSNVTGPGDRPEIVAFQRLPD